MSKRILYTIVTAMGLSLLGIIGVQLYWIDNARSVKEAQFDHHVTLALNATLADLDQREQVFFLKNQMEMPQGCKVIRTKVAKNGETLEDVTEWVMKCVGQDGHELEECSDTGTCVLMHADGKSDLRVEVSRDINKIQRIVIIDGEEEITSEENIEIMIQMHDTGQFEFSNVMVKMVEEFSRRDDPLKSKLQGINLQKVLTTELKNNGIDLPFKYAITSKDKILKTYTTAGFIPDELNSKHRIDLFQGDIVERPEELVLLFSGKQGWVLGEMWFMLMVSVLFTVIILLTFASTVYFMLKQKKLADIKNDFIDNMTHEFKTPISTISLALDSITHPKVKGNTERIEEYAEIIRQENRRMNKQVESVLNTALAERKELNLDEKEMDIHRVIERLCDRMHLTFESNGGSLTTDLQASTTITMGDEMHLHNVLSNLVDNAIKYSQGIPKVYISTQDVTSGYMITVRDEGMGMSAETQKKAFEKFFRQQKGNLHAVKGFGIGLSYVKAIVEAHNGTVKIISQLGQGTSVHITMPSKFKLHAETA